MNRPPQSTKERLYRSYRKIRFLLQKGTLFTIPGQKINSSESPNTVQPYTYLIITVNSVTIFLLSYLLVYFVMQLVTAISASVFNINSIIHYYGVDYLIRGSDWTSDAVSTVFSSGPLISIFFAILLFILYYKVVSETGLLRLFVLWCFCHMIINFFGNMLVGAMLNEGFGYVIMYQFVMDTGKMVLTLFAFICIFLIGLFMTRLFLYSGNIYFNTLNRYNRLKFAFSQFLLPFIFGNIIILLLKIPEVKLFEILLNGCTLLLILPVIFRSINLQDLYFDEEPRKIKFASYYILITLLMMIGFRVGLGIGIRI